MKIKLCIGVVLFAVATAWAQTNNLTTLLQQGLFEEQANRNLDAAIENYAVLARQFDKDRQIAATAVFRLGECYRAQGKTNEAAAQYQRILRDFADQKTLVTLSHQNLAGMEAVVPTRGSARDSNKTESSDAGVADEAGVLAAKLNGLQTFKGDPERYAKAVLGLFPDDRLRKMLEQLAGLQAQEAKLKADPKAELNSYRVAISGRLETLDLSSSVVKNLEWASGETQKQLKLISEHASEIISEQNFRLEVLQSVANASPTKNAASPAMEDNEDKEIRRIQQMIQNSPDLINAPEPMSSLGTPLIKVAYFGWLKAAAFLLDHGADVNRSAADVVQGRELADAGRASPLLAAVAAGNKAMTQFLIEHGANVNFKGENNGVTPLHLAARKGFQAVVEVLLASHADVNATDNAGQTPLFSAVQGGQIKIIQMLVAAGAKPNVKDGKDNTVLNFAIKTSPEMFQVLLAVGTDPNTVDAKNRTPLSYAVERDSLEVVNMLLAAKADPNADSYNPPLMCAIANKNLAAAETLLKAGANSNAVGGVDFPDAHIQKNANYLNHQGRLTPLWLAIYMNQPAMVQLLLKYKADPNELQTDGKSLLFSALDKPEILNALLDAGAKVDARDATAAFYNNKCLHWTPLLLAVENNSSAVAVEILLQHGANPNLQDDAFGDTALGWSAGWGVQRVPESKILELLLEHKADPNIRNFGGMTLLNRLKNKQRDASPSDQVAINKLADLLSQHGALYVFPNWDRIDIRRPSANFSEPVYYQGTNGWNRFTLLEALLNFYGSSRTHSVSQGNGMQLQSSGDSVLPFPDLSRVVILRPSQGSTNQTRIVVNLPNQTNGIDCSKDVPLEFGDVVEIPEREHALGDKPVGLTESQRATLFGFLKGWVRLVVRGQTVEILVYPSFDSSLSGVLEKSEARNLLLSSSDLSKVKVTRRDPKTGKKREWILDCRPSPASSNGVVVFSGINQPQPPYSELWLRDGDVIEVPEQP